MNYLDHLFYDSLDELIHKPKRELERCKHYALTLLMCLDSVLAIKAQMLTTGNDRGTQS